jgi:hypothetical protein
MKVACLLDLVEVHFLTVRVLRLILLDKNVGDLLLAQTPKMKDNKILKSVQEIKEKNTDDETIQKECSRCLKEAIRKDPQPNDWCVIPVKARYNC